MKHQALLVLGRPPKVRWDEGRRLHKLVRLPVQRGKRFLISGGIWGNDAWDRNGLDNQYLRLYSTSQVICAYANGCSTNLRSSGTSNIPEYGTLGFDISVAVALNREGHTPSSNAQSCL